MFILLIVIMCIVVIIFLLSNIFNNFKRIAKHTAYIHEYLKQQYASKVETNEQLPVLAGAIFAYRYLMEGSITTNDLRNCYLFAKIGRLHLSDSEEIEIPGHSDLASLMAGPDQTFNYFVLQLQCLIFHADSHTSPQLIMRSVAAKMPGIIASISRARKRYAIFGCPIAMKQSTDTFMLNVLSSQMLAEFDPRKGFARPD